jgi:hypothetical protein
LEYVEKLEDGRCREEGVREGRWMEDVEKRGCASKAIFYCPSMNSHRPRSQNTTKERTLNPEKDSTKKRPKSHVSLEKSSKN